jgi:membrane protein required for colicin V production
MNWIDGVLIALLLAMVIVGSKKGLIRELMAFAVFFVAIIVSINYIDNLAVWVYDQLGGSPLISALLSFVILLAISYAAFKLIGMLFYKVASLKTAGRRDQMGGALVGFLRGWLAASFLTLLVFLLPMPDAFYTSFESSFFGPAVAKTIPLIYDNTSAVHPRNPAFMSQVENTLLIPSRSSDDSLSGGRQDVHRAIYQIDRFFNPAY